MKTLPFFFACLFCLEHATAQSVVIVSDDFSGATLDTSKWTAITDGIPGASVVQSFGVVELTDKAYLRSNAQVDPHAAGETRVRGRWRWVTVNPELGTLEVLTRTDAVPAGQYYEAANGLEFNLWLGPAYPGVAVIQPRGSLIQVGPTTITGSLQWVPGEWYEFEAVDSITHASWTVRQESDPSNVTHATCAVLSSNVSLNYVAIHGREDIGGPNICDLDDYSIEVADCNSNQVPDGLDVSSGTSSDCNGNHAPDECEIASDSSLDLNNNGVLDSCECVVTSYCIAAPNTAGPGALMDHAGTVSVGLNNLTLLCSGCPPNASGVFFYGPEQTQVAFGNGYRCVAGQLTRLGLSVAGPSGIAAKSVNYPSRPPSASITPGSTWNFQFWYRNPAAGGANFNLSNGLSIRFCP